MLARASEVELRSAGFVTTSKKSTRSRKLEKNPQVISVKFRGYVKSDLKSEYWITYAACVSIVCFPPIIRIWALGKWAKFLPRDLCSIEICSEHALRGKFARSK